MKIVKLKTAYHWHCEECGADNFDVGIKSEFGHGKKEEFFRDLHDMDEFEELPKNWEQFEVVCIPKVVTCCKCGEEFETMDERMKG